MTATDYSEEAIPETYEPRSGPANSPMKNMAIAALGEFFGTFIFLWTAFVIAQIAN